MQSDTAAAQFAFCRPGETRTSSGLPEGAPLRSRRRSASRVTAPRSGSLKWRLREPLHQARGHHVLWNHIQRQAPRQLAGERPGPRLFRLRGPRVRHLLQLRAGVALPLRRPPPDLRPGDAQGGVAPHLGLALISRFFLRNFGPFSRKKIFAKFSEI